MNNIVSAGSGTVTLANSKTVNGSGTSFIADFRNGMKIAHGGYSAFVESVQSNTKLTLTENWQGATGSGKPYTVINETGYAANASIAALQQVNSIYDTMRAARMIGITDGVPEPTQIGQYTWMRDSNTGIIYQVNAAGTGWEALDNTTQAEMQASLSSMRETVDGYTAGARKEQSHFRLTKNQILKPNGAGTFPVNWSSGYLKSARIVETVSTGVVPSQRSALAQEFLAAAGANSKYFRGSFHIWEYELRQHRGDANCTTAYFGYQYVPLSNYITVGAIVKHISGAVPYHSYCNGLEANQPAKICTTKMFVNRNHYTNIHPYVRDVNADYETPAKIQLAMPAAISGYVDTSKGWGVFPYVGDDAFNK